MGKRQRYLVFTVLLLLFCLSWLGAETDGPKLFVLNLSSFTLDIRLQDEETKAFEAHGVRPNWATRLEPLKERGDFVLYFRQTGEDRWYQWADKPGSPVPCRVESGNVYCILFTREGEILYSALDEEYTESPQVCFANLSGKALSEVELGEAWQHETKLELENLKDRTITGFLPVLSGSHAFFWAFQDNELDHYTYIDQEREEPEFFELQKGEYYIFAVAAGRNTVFPLVFKITPYY
jgi:hypothetical protein